MSVTVRTICEHEWILPAPPAEVRHFPEPEVRQPVAHAVHPTALVAQQEADVAEAVAAAARVEGAKGVKSLFSSRFSWRCTVTSPRPPLVTTPQPIRT